MADFVGDFTTCRDVLLQRLQEPAPARIQLLTGPRQVGKTTLLLEIAGRLGEGAVYAAGDELDASLPGFWERLWTGAQERARQRTAVLLIDEVHHFPHWAERLKGQWDHLRRKNLRLHIIASGSSALRVTAGSRESLAGRFERVTLTHWSALSFSKVFHLAPRDAALHSVRFGSYPGAMELEGEFQRWRAFLRDAIIEPAIARDVLTLGGFRRPGLLRQVFAVAAASPAQIVSLQKLQGQLQEKGALETIASYLALLRDA